MRKAFGIACMMLAAAMCASANAADLRSLKRLIAAELVYPREIVYTLPALLPAKGESAGKNAEYLRVLDALKGTGVLRAVMDGERTRVAVAGDNFDVVRQHANMRYEVMDFSLLLGEWRVEVDSVSDEGAVKVARGRRYAAKATRISKRVLESLPEGERWKYTSVPLRWTIERVNGRERISEKAGAEP